jgi:hypothetical protein
MAAIQRTTKQQIIDAVEGGGLDVCVEETQ